MPEADGSISGESSFLQIGEIQQGADIPLNAAWLRIRAGEAVAARIALYGDRVPARELLRLGLVAEVVADAGNGRRDFDLRQTHPTRTCPVPGGEDFNAEVLG